MKRLKDDIAVNGLRLPITVDQRMGLMAGGARLQACKKLGLDVKTQLSIIPTDLALGRMPFAHHTRGYMERGGGRRAHHGR